MNSPQNHSPIALPLSADRTDSSQQIGRLLTVVERRDLVRLEGEVRRDLKAFMRVGRALLEIKRRKLYREKYNSFEEYCHAVWGWKKSQAYRMLEAADICSQLSHTGNAFLPKNERQVRPLRGLSIKTATRAWKLAVTRAHGKPITCSMVTQAVHEVDLSSKPVQERPTWRFYIEPVLKQATAMLKQGDREKFELLIQKISCLLLVGKCPSPAEEDLRNAG